MSKEFKEQFEQLRKKQDADWERYQKLLPATEEVELVVLKGHLIVEEMLNALVAEHCGSPEHLESARLSFNQLSVLARSILYIPIADEKCWQAIGALNALRNKLSHHLEPKDVEEHIKKLEKLCPINLPEGIKPAETLADRAKAAICYIIGLLSAISVVAGTIERNRKLA